MHDSMHRLFSNRSLPMAQPGNMRRNMDLCRQILFDLEGAPPLGLKTIKMEGHTDEEVSYHIYLLASAGLIEGKDGSSSSGYKWYALRITWDGQQFLDAVRDS